MNPAVEQRELSTAVGQAIGLSARWENGQYCALHAPKGVVGCGIFDLTVAEGFGMAMAIARGTPEKPLVQPEDLYGARIVELTPQARELGIVAGMTGLEALARMM